MAETKPIYKVFLSSRFEEFEELRDRVATELGIGSYEIDQSFLRIDPKKPGSQGALETSVQHAREADVLLLLLGRSYGDPAPGRDESFVHLEFKAAAEDGNARVLVWRVTVAGAGPVEPKMETFIQDILASDKYRIGELTIEDWSNGNELNAVAIQIQRELEQALRELEQTEQTSPIGQRVPGFGRQIRTTRSTLWSDSVIGVLDLDIFGEPARRGSRDRNDLVGRTDDEWNEACKAFRIRSTDITIGHLRRAVELRPMDGTARYWLARLLLTEPLDERDLREIQTHAGVAAAALADRTEESANGDRWAARAALAYLVSAKTSRLSGDFASGADFARLSTEEFGERFAEPHLELSYSLTEAGDQAGGYEAFEAAFSIDPPALRRASEQFERFEAGDRAHDQYRDRLASVISVQIGEMTAYGARLLEHQREATRAVDRLRGDVANVLDDLLGQHRTATGFVVRSSAPVNQAEPSARSRNPDLDDATEGTEVGRLVSYGAQVPSRDPDELVSVARSLSRDALRRLREVEATLRRATDVLVGAVDADSLLPSRLPEPRRQSAVLAVFGVALAILIGWLAGSSTVGLVVAGLVVVGIAWNLVRVISRNRDRTKSTGELVELVASTWRSHTQEFEHYVREYERIHLVWKVYGPSETTAELLDLDLEAALFVERRDESDLVAEGYDPDVLAPDLRRVRAGLDRAGLGRTTSAEPIGRSALSAPPLRLLRLAGRVESLRSGTDVPTPARWKAYREPGEGEVEIDGSEPDRRWWLIIETADEIVAVSIEQDAVAEGVGRVETATANWYPDPSHRFELRYWDGGRWTEHVARNGETFQDPLRR